MGIPAAIAGGLGIARGFSDYEAGRSQANALRMQAMENEVAITEQIVQRQTKLRKVMGAQIAQGAAQGIAPSSASFEAIQDDSINSFAKDRDALTLELDIENANLEAQARNSERTGFLKGAGDIIGGGASIFGASSGFGISDDFDGGEMPDIFGVRADKVDIFEGGV